MRLFAGIALSPDLATQVSRVRDDLRRRVQAQAPRARVTWVASDRLHVTVRFIGDVDEARRAEIQPAFERALDEPAFELTVAGVGAFPSAARPRVYWAGLTNGRDAVIRIERELAARLDPFLGPGEQRAFSPHITIGRVKESAGLNRRLLDGLEPVTIGTMRVTALTLFESRLSPQGPDYRVLAAAPTA